MKKIYKLTPVSTYDIVGIESWLEEMARRGLHLKKFRPLFCTFEEGPSARTRYRVEPHRRYPDDDLPQSKLDLYEQFGWNCVCEVNRAKLIFATDDAEAPELHTDPSLLLELWTKERRSLRRSNWISALFLLLLLSLTWFALFGQGMPVLALVTTSAAFMLIALPYFFFSLASSIADVRHLSQLIYELEQGTLPEHKAFRPKRQFLTLSAFLFSVVFCALLIVGHYILPFTDTGIQPLHELEAFVPLSLAALEGEGYVADSAVFPIDRFSGTHKVPEPVYVDYANFCSLEHTLLCKDWRVVQTGERREDDVWVRMEIHWYDLPGSALSVPLAREQLNRAMALEEDIWWTAGESVDWSAEFFHREDADFLAVAHRQDDPHFQAAAVAKDDKVAVVRYSGHGALADHLDRLASMVN